jgi:hypothetical protein
MKEVNLRCYLKERLTQSQEKMAAMNIITERRPQWIKQGAHWIKNDSPSSSIHSLSGDWMEKKETPIDTEVLLNILRVLRKMESKMEIQGKRLEILETTSPISAGGTTLFNESPISRNPGSRGTANMPSAISSPTSSSTSSEDYKVSNEYECSLVKLRMDWEIDEAISFVNDQQNPLDVVSLNDANVISQEISNKSVSNWADLVSEPREVDLYSISMYTGDLLESGTTLDLPKQSGNFLTPWLQGSPPAPSAQPTLAHEDDGPATEDDRVYEGSNEPQNLDEQLGCEERPSFSGPESWDEHTGADITTMYVQTNTEIAPQKRISINIGEVKTNSSYIKIELSFYALDNWKQGVLSRIRNDLKSFWKQEKQRYSELRQKHRVKDVAQQVFDKMRSALEREWREEKRRLEPLLSQRKKGVKILRWRIVLTFRNFFHISQDHSENNVIC